MYADISFKEVEQFLRDLTNSNDSTITDSQKFLTNVSINGEPVGKYYIRIDYKPSYAGNYDDRYIVQICDLKDKFDYEYETFDTNSYYMKYSIDYATNKDYLGINYSDEQYTANFMIWLP